MLSFARRKFVYVLIGTAFLLGSARAAVAGCWQWPEGVYCVVCTPDSSVCCTSFYANGWCCEPTSVTCDADE